ncbi:MAG: phosphoribosylformylglycinamidine cyclo-ligase [Thermodesulfobacteriota bacterium]
MKKTISYKDAGVDIKEGERLVESIKPIVKETFRPEVINGIGGFAGLFSLNLTTYKNPVLVSATDGVGTKLKIAFSMDKHETVGIDLVAMSVNDIVVLGAEPLFFLDYLATGKLQREKMKKLIAGIAAGCKTAGCSLLGGETAEMPGFYNRGEYDLAGFAVGVVEKNKIIDGSEIQTDDIIIGLASSGLHSNGFSLVRKIIFEELKLDLNDRINGFDRSLGEELLSPTRIYVQTIMTLLKDFKLNGLAHITGGGLTENIPRILPSTCKAIIKKNAWDKPPIFKFLQDGGGIADDEMFKVFNNGIGMVIVVRPNIADDIMSSLKASGEKATIIGEIVKRKSDEVPIVIE